MALELTDRASVLPGWIAGASASRVRELPRRPPANAEAPSDTGRRQRLAAVVAGYHAATNGPDGSTEPDDPDGGGRLLLGWYRRGAHDPVQIFTVGGVSGGSGEDGRVPLSLPPGALGTRYADGDLYRMLDTMPCWTRLTGITDALLGEDPTLRLDDVRPSLDECLLRVWRDGFAWFILAEPIPAAEITEQALIVAAQEREAQTKSSSPEHAVRAARLGLRHRELRQGESSGLWRIHLLAGGPTGVAAAAIAGLLCSSADLSHLPYAIAPTPIRGDLTTVLAGEERDRSPFVGSSLLVASLAVSPVEEVPGVRLVMRSEFDVTPETSTDRIVAGLPATRSTGVTIGSVLDHNGVPVEGLRMPLSSLNRHTFVCGATGAGKSQTVRHLLEEATHVGLPWLVVEPAKAEYRQMADRLGTAEVITIRPGDADTAPAGFNPLRPAEGFALQTHADLVRSLFLAAFEADEPFPQVLGAALTRSYEDLGWDLALGEPRIAGHRPRYPSLGDLQQVAERVVDEIGYGREITDNVRGFIRVRLSSLRLGTTGRFFEGGHPLDFAALMRRNVVFEIEDVGDDRDKAFLMGALLIQLVEHLRVEIRRHPELARQGLRHVSVFEEAHRLLRRTDHPGPAAHAVELFASLLAEIRAYGEGLVIAEQIPSKLVPDVIKNTAVKIMHRLPALDDRDAVGATVNLTDRQSQYLVTLPPGTGAVFSDGMDQPVLVRMPDGSDREKGGLTPTSAATDIIGRRSSTCGTQCLGTPCTLRDMRTAQHLLGDEPWIVLWTELAVVGHLTGWPVPALRAEHLRVLWAASDRLAQCALSHAVDEAVAVRSATLSPGSDPAEFAAHVLASLEGQLIGQRRCATEEIRYLARPYRWSRLWDELSTVDSSERHPRTTEWESAYRRAIPGATSAAQAAVVKSWLDNDQRDARALRLVSFGARTPSALERAVESSFDAEDWTTRLGDTVSEHFADATWPGRSLGHRRPAGDGGTGG